VGAHGDDGDVARDQAVQAIPAERIAEQNGIVPTDSVNALLPASGTPQPATLGVRSEHVTLDGPLSGTVVLDEYLGAWRNLHVQTAGGRIVARVAADRPHRIGEAVRLGVDPAHCSLFGADGARL